MANLKAGTTVGGAIVWNAGNLAFLPVAPNTLMYKNGKVYTEHTPPTAPEVDAVSAKTGGTFLKKVTFAEGLVIPAPDGTKIGGMVPGSTDAALFSGCNININTHYGIGVNNTSNAGRFPNQISIVFDARDGHVKSKGGVYADAGVFDAGNRVWSDSNSPTKEQMNAIWRTGDEVTGTFTFNGTGLRLNIGASLSAQFEHSNGVREYVGLASIQGTIVSIGSTHNRLTETRIQTPFISSLKVRYGNEVKAIFHEGFAPTAAQVGLDRVTNDAQLKRDGDSVPGSDFTFRSLSLATNPTAATHAVRRSYMEDQTLVRRADITTQDWNTLKDQGMYRVMNGTGANRPNAYMHGILNIFVGAAGRMVQEYIPHRQPNSGNDLPAYSLRHYRIWDSNNDYWIPWMATPHLQYLERMYLGLDGGTMREALTMTANKWIRGGDKDLIVYDAGANRVVMGDISTSTYLRVSDAKKLYVATDTSNATGGANVGQIYSQLNKPTAEDVGLGNLDNLPAIPSVVTQAGSGVRYYKIGTCNFSANGDAHIQFMVAGIHDYGQLSMGTDIVSVSARGVTADTTLTPALVNSLINVTRVNGERIFGDNTTNTASYFATKTATGLTFWVRSPNYSTGMNVSFLNKSGTLSAWEYTGAFEAAPAGAVQATVTYLYTTARPPTPADVSLGNVQNIEQVPLNGSKAMTGTLTTPSLRARQWVHVGGQENFTPGEAGAWLTYTASSGATDLYNHRGTAGGGFRFFSSDNSGNKVIASIDTVGKMTVTSLQAGESGRLPAGDAFDTNGNLFQPEGFQMLPQTGVVDAGYPGSNGTGLLIKFKANQHRHMQMYTTGGGKSAGSTANRWYIRNMRADDTDPDNIKWQELVTDANVNRTIGAKFIDVDAVIDLGVVT